MIKIKINYFILTGILLFVVTTLFYATLYAVNQQNLRSNANDPQIQIAEDGARQLPNIPPSQIQLSQSVDFKNSLAPFIMVFDKNGKLLQTSLIKDSLSPTVPSSVFAKVKANSEERFTWEPVTGLRFAAVMDYYSSANTSGYVMAARSLKEVERRENNLLIMVFIAWAITLLLSFLLLYVSKTKLILTKK